jgi:hypothetical protein
MDYFKFSIEKLYNDKERKEEIGAVLSVLHIDGQKPEIIANNEKELILEKLSDYAHNQLYRDNTINIFYPLKEKLSIVALTDTISKSSDYKEAKIYLKQYE